MLKKKLWITVSVAVLTLFLVIGVAAILHLDVHAGLLMDGGQSQVTIKPANGTDSSTFTATINGQPVTPNQTYLYNSSTAGDIVLTPARGYRFKNVYLQDEEGDLYVWTGDTPCTQQDIDDDQFDARITASFTDPEIRNLFFSRNPDGSYNYNGAMTLSKNFLTTDPHEGWSKGEPILFPHQSTSTEFKDFGVVGIVAETEYIPVNHVDIREKNSQVIADYSYGGRQFIDVEELEKAVNADIDAHKILSGEIISIGFGREVLGVTTYEYPRYSALITFSDEQAQFLIFGEHEITIYFVYPTGSRGIIIPIHTLPLPPDPDPPPTMDTPEFFGTYVDSVTVTSNNSSDSTTLYTYDSLNSYLESLYTGTVVNLAFSFKPGVYIQNSSVGTVSDGTTVNGVTLNGPEPIWADTGEGRVLAGSWSGTLVDGSDGDEPHYAFGTVEWNQEYTEGTTTEMALTITEPPNPQVGLLPLKASELESGQPGILAVAYVYTPQGVELASDAAITISGSLNDTDNPNPKVEEEYATLPEATYEVSEELSYCGYWFYPNNGTDFQYFYSFTVEATLTSGEVTDRREIVIEFEGTEIS